RRLVGRHPYAASRHQPGALHAGAAGGRLEAAAYTDQLAAHPSDAVDLWSGHQVPDEGAGDLEYDQPAVDWASQRLPQARDATARPLLQSQDRTAAHRPRAQGAVVRIQVVEGPLRLHGE